MDSFRSRAGLAVAVVWTLATPTAQADIYRWINEDGGVVYSDVPPQDRQRITEVFPVDKTAPSVAPAPPTSLEIQALAGEVELLRNELAEERRARRAAEAAAHEPPPPPVSPAAVGTCDPAFGNCAWPVAAPYFPATVIISTPIVHRVHRGHHHVPPRHFKRGPPSRFLDEGRVGSRVPTVFHSGQGSFRRH